MTTDEINAKFAEALTFVYDEDAGGPDGAEIIELHDGEVRVDGATLYIDGIVYDILNDTDGDSLTESRPKIVAIVEEWVASLGREEWEFFSASVIKAY